MSVQEAKARLVQAFSDYIDELTTSIRKGASSPTPPPIPSPQPTTRPVERKQPRPRPRVDAVVELPKPLMPGRNASELSDAVRKASMKDGLPHAARIVAALGDANDPHFVAALQGKLALERIAFDSKLLADLQAAVR